MKIREIWNWDKLQNEYTCKVRAQKTLTSEEFKEFSGDGSIVEVTVSLFKNLQLQLQEYIDMLEKEGFHV